ncbi:MAG: iron transporter [Sphingomonas sp.]|nr:MAG: iron transporter [Sphingomonas sp.]
MKFTHRLRVSARLKQLGPGLITGAADDDPSGIATYSQAGAQFGFGLLWTMLLTYPLMCAVQLVSAHIGRVTGKGLASNMAAAIPRPLVLGLVLLLFVANTINIAADLAMMGDVARLVTGVPPHWMTILFAILSLGLQLFVPYPRYASFLKWLTLSLFSYFAVLLLVKLNWAQVATGLFIPRIPNEAALVMIVAIFGTTISPYLFFWQSAQEVEEMGRHHERPLRDDGTPAAAEFKRINFDTLSGMAISNLVAMAIIIATAATLHANGQHDIQTAADAANALKPIAGNYAFALFSLGIIGTGLLAVPVLAGSAAYAIGEAEGWKSGLDHKPWEAIGFYGVIIAATLLGLVIQFAGIDPIKALFWSAVINGVVAVPIMAAMMYVAVRPAIMGALPISRPLAIWGWLATAVMAAAVVAMALTGGF